VGADSGGVQIPAYLALQPVLAVGFNIELLAGRAERSTHLAHLIGLDKIILESPHPSLGFARTHRVQPRPPELRFQDPMVPARDPAGREGTQDIVRDAEIVALAAAAISL